MKEVVFATGNKGKVKTLEGWLRESDYRVVQRDIDVPEPQADFAHEIALAKAEYAYQQLGKPVVVQDSSFHIHALGGFPGPYIKYINTTIGPDGILKLLKGVGDRSAHYEQALAYVDGQTRKVFNSAYRNPGSIATELYSNNSTRAWSEMWRIYIPHGQEKVLAALSHEEVSVMEKRGGDKSEFGQFAMWLRDRVSG